MVQRNVTVGTLPRKQQGNTFTLCGLNHRKFRVCLCQPTFQVTTRKSSAVFFP